MNAWCHGAPGILLSRMKLEELFPEDMQIKKDRLNAADSLFYGEQDEKICLCHGMSGNLLIMKKYLRKYGNKKMKEQYEALCDCLLFQLDHPAKISGTEYLNLAFMNGINGNFMKTKGTPADCKFMVSRCFFYLFSEIYLRISFFFIRLTYWRDSFSFRAIWASLLS